MVGEFVDRCIGREVIDAIAAIQPAVRQINTPTFYGDGWIKQLLERFRPTRNLGSPKAEKLV